MRTMSASFPEMEKRTSSGSSVVWILSFGMEKKKLSVWMKSKNWMDEWI
jgi:hypothetical protein